MTEIVLLISGHYFVDNGRYFYFLGITLKIAGFIGINSFILNTSVRYEKKMQYCFLW